MSLRMFPVRRRAALILCGLALLSALASAAPALAGPGGEAPSVTFTVNSNDDVDDGSCDGTHCSLREAIDAANSNSGTDTIAFNIPGAGPHTIQPTSPLPDITDPVIIDGTTEPDFTTTPVIELDGSLAGSGATVDGLRITAGNSTVKGLVINRFDSDGIYLTSNGANVIQGNFIGTNVTGTVAQGNQSDGVFVEGVPNNTIGGTAPGEGNLISDNLRGVDMSGGGATGNVVQGNLIGTDVNGTAGLGNWWGVVISDASGNTIGGSTGGAGNTISGNLYGVFITGGAASGNSLEGNFIGTDINGTAALGNAFWGVEILDAPGNTIGGTAAGTRNIISASGVDGILIDGAGSTGNMIYGNYIGTDVNGTSDLGNGFDGVHLSNGSGTIIGSTAAGGGNVISGNNGDGVELAGTATTLNTLQANYIGADASGTADLGNGGNGILLSSSPGNTIGGTTEAARNVISGNDQAGVKINGAGGTGNVVTGNYIGTDKNGTGPMANDSHGVLISASANNNTVGGTDAGAGNIIAYNNGSGVAVLLSTGVAVLSNSIFSNSPTLGLGIDLDTDGVTANDAGDGDSGANNLQNFPVLTLATAGSTNVEGSLNSTASTTFRIEFFSSSSCHASDHGEGETFLGSSTETTDTGGNVSFTVNLAPAVPAGYAITATATDPNNNTSEFSECVTLVPSDTDGDGCADSEEAAGALPPRPGATGAFDPNDPNDFFDVPVPANPDPTPNGTRDKIINMGDVLAVLLYFGADDNGAVNGNGVDYDSDKDADTVEDGLNYDRTASAVPNPPWNAGGPNGVINTEDVLAALAQVGLDCTQPP